MRFYIMSLPLPLFICWSSLFPITASLFTLSLLFDVYHARCIYYQFFSFVLFPGFIFCHCYKYPSIATLFFFPVFRPTFLINLIYITFFTLSSFLKSYFSCFLPTFYHNLYRKPLSFPFSYTLRTSKSYSRVTSILSLLTSLWISLIEIFHTRLIFLSYSYISSQHSIQIFCINTIYIILFPHSPHFSFIFFTLLPDILYLCCIYISCISYLPHS